MVDLTAFGDSREVFKGYFIFYSFNAYSPQRLCADVHVCAYVFDQRCREKIKEIKRGKDFFSGIKALYF